ncbi:type IX secretion system outer membrane channel protein PorV [Winogradskyella aurantiaca]|uniref:type IX secretion system outer membrane channel protein PorV n=1 Tax=Winogradskyella aurantiaca TaxID=2219558 RepID=UPI000E1E0890|nr:type IX secretion system outer membrane channel protein PorV [Winogradskyella aurantiaca]
MKNYLPILFCFLAVMTLNAQDIIVQDIPDPNDSRVITTGIPFLLVAPDARAASLGDQGVATGQDVFSQHWNMSKYAFSEAKSGLGISYTPYLSRLANDIDLGYVAYFNRLNEFSAVSGSFRYFGLGEILLTQGPNDPGVLVNPNEFALDLGYSLRLSNQFAMSIGMRYVRSDLRLAADPNSNAQAANTFNVDISGYYQSEEIAYTDFNGRWHGGFAIQNLGPKFRYDDGGQQNFQPSNLRLGGGFDFIFDQYNTLALNAEFTKLLVPTPPLRGDRRTFEDVDGDGVYDPDVDNEISYDEGVILAGRDDNVDFLSGVFQSFGDAPGGFSEELREITWALGAEYRYQDSFSLRGGYFNEASDKGGRSFFSLGAGFKYTTIEIDLSYLFATGALQNPLENTLRFSLTFNFGEETYQEF